SNFVKLKEACPVAHRFKILVTDDDPDILELNSTILRKVGYEVYEASSAKETLEMVRTHRPDLIILDVILPDMRGTRLCRMIKDDPDLRGPFIILMSGVQISSNNQAKGLNVGADGYLVKPVSKKEFIARVQAMERIKQAEDALMETKKEQEATIEKLQKALEEIKTLRGLIPICAWCKKIRDDEGYWDELEVYLSKHSEAVFSHGLCPECSKAMKKKIEED
ncbi:MAG: response regulator, partial [Syntrophorhabdaceae bacterium]|nr:response regulator [Syntrophorhabdaceae bacterium]